MRPYAVDSIARALVRAVAEHGAPNTFGCTEIGALAVLRPARVGQIGCGYLADLQSATRDNFADFTVDYNRKLRRFVVSPK